MPPGTRIAVRPSDRGAWPEPWPYWSLSLLAADPEVHPIKGSDEEAVETLDGLLRKSVRMRRRADVPVGAFLSGGTDSSTIVSLASGDASHPVKTFSIGMHDQNLDEAPAARAVADHPGCEHSELCVEESDGLDIVPRKAL